jgi:anti-anti-sigma factor
MQVSVHRHAGYALVQLRGELDAFSYPQFVAEVEGEIGSGPHLVVLNLQGVRFIDSTGMEAILRISCALTERGGKLAVSSPSSFCRGVMERTGLDRILPIRASDDAARDALSSEDRVPG